MDIRAPLGIQILRVLYELARDRVVADMEQLLLRVAKQLPPRSSSSSRGARGGDVDFRFLKTCLESMERADLVELFADGRIRLTMTGFAMAVAIPEHRPLRKRKARAPQLQQQAAPKKEKNEEKEEESTRKTEEGAVAA